MDLEKIDVIHPMPCTNVPQKTVKEWFAKLDEELNEIKEVVYSSLDADDDMKDFHMDGDIDHFAEECADMNTTLASMQEYAGVLIQKRTESQDGVNKKNHERGYW